MGKSIFIFIKVSVLVILTLIIGLVFYHEVWFLEYYHLPQISFVKIESERTKLINGIESYQSIDEFKSFLSRSSFQWEGKAGQPSPKGRPPFNMYTITIKNYSHLGFPGELNVGFFNNRLNGTLFHPLDIEKYVTALKAAGIIFDKNGETDIAPFTHVRYSTNYKGLQYIDWSDIRLDKEIDLWIRRYS